MASGQVAQQLEITGSIPAVTLRTTGKSSHTHTHTHTSTSVHQAVETGSGQRRTSGAGKVTASLKVVAAYCQVYD